MKLTIDLESIDLSDYFDEDETPTLSEIFRNEFKEALVTRFRFDPEIKMFVEQTIRHELIDAIYKYKDDAVLKAVIEEVVSKQFRNHSLLFFNGEVAANRIKTLAEERMAIFEKECTEDAIRAAKSTIQDLAKDFFANSEFAQYIDYKKITEDVMKYLKNADNRKPGTTEDK